MHLAPGGVIDEEISVACVLLTPLPDHPQNNFLRSLDSTARYRSSPGHVHGLQDRMLGHGNSEATQRESAHPSTQLDSRRSRGPKLRCSYANQSPAASSFRCTRYIIIIILYMLSFLFARVHYFRPKRVRVDAVRLSPSFPRPTSRTVARNSHPLDVVR